MSTLINVHRVYQNEISDIPIQYGNVILTKNSIPIVYVDYETGVRDEVSDSFITVTGLSTLDELDDNVKLINKIYFVSSTGKMYRLKENKFVEVKYIEDLLDTISYLDEYFPYMVGDENGAGSPYTIVNQVLANTGKTVTATLDESNILTLFQTKTYRVAATRDHQRIFDIPFPKEDYNFNDGDTLVIIKDMEPLDTSKYVINNKCLILNDVDMNGPEIYKGNILLYLFHYKLTYDLNKAVMLGTQNIANGSITTEKLSPNMEFPATKVAETAERTFMTPEEHKKLAGIEEGALNNPHPATHSANMIDETDDRCFLTKEQRETVLKKPDFADVYTQEQIDQKFRDLIGTNPGILDTLQELSDALNGDAKFAETVFGMINKKADQTDFENLSAEVETKISNKDYVHSCIYSTPTHSSIEDGYDLYSISVNDDNLLEYIDGMNVVLKIKDKNNGPSYFRINQLANIPIKAQGGYDLVEGDWQDGDVVSLRYNGTTGNFILQGKGGVSLIDTIQKEYQVAFGENITKGNIVDILQDNTVCISRPHILFKSLHQTSDKNFYSNGKVDVFPLSETSFIAFWLVNKTLRCKYIEVRNNYIDMADNSFILVNTDIEDFNITNINGNCAIVYRTSSNLVSVRIISNNEGTLSVPSTGFDKLDTYKVSNIQISTSENRLVVIWESNGNSNIYYFKIEADRSFTPIMNNTNSGYFSNNMIKLSDNQLLFGKVQDDMIKLWVLNLTESSYFCTSIVSHYAEPTDSIENFNIVRKDNTHAILNWNKGDGDLIYTRTITVDEVGGIVGSDIISDDITPEKIPTYTGDKFIQVDDKYYVVLSKNNINIPSLNGDYRNCLKLSLTTEGTLLNSYETIDIPFYNTSNYNIRPLGNNTYIIIFNSKQLNNDVEHLYFGVYKIKKTPDGVAITRADSTGLVKVKEWN